MFLKILFQLNKNAIMEKNGYKPTEGGCLKYEEG